MAQDNGATDFGKQAPTSTARPLIGGRRALTALQVSAILAAGIIPTQGPNKLMVVGRGNPFTREDGTPVRIFNVAAFASMDDAKAAAEFYGEGLKLEESGKLAEAQEWYKNALNLLMSFSVTEQNAHAYDGIFQIGCIVSMVPTKDRDAKSPTFGQVKGEKLGVNQPRPVAIATSGQAVANLFKRPAATTPSADANYALRQQLGAGRTNGAAPVAIAEEAHVDEAGGQPE